MGFLNGVDFLWPLRALLPLMLTISAILLALFYAIDLYAWRKERPRQRAAGRPRIRIQGSHNFIYLGLIAVVIFGTGIWKIDRTIPVGLGIVMHVRGWSAICCCWA